MRGRGRPIAQGQRDGGFLMMPSVLLWSVGGLTHGIAFFPYSFDGALKARLRHFAAYPTNENVENVWLWHIRATVEMLQHSGF